MSARISRSASSPFAGIHLVAGAVAEPRRALRRVAERPVERARELRGVGEDPDVRRVPPRRARRGSPRPVRPSCRSARPCCARARPARARSARRFERRVVVDVAVVGQDAAVAVVGVLVQAQVGDQHVVVAVLLAQHRECALRDAVRVPGSEPWRPWLRDANTMNAVPSRRVSPASLRSDSSVCGTARASTRWDGSAMPSFTNSGAISCRG